MKIFLSLLSCYKTKGLNIHKTKLIPRLWLENRAQGDKMKLFQKPAKQPRRSANKKRQAIIVQGFFGINDLVKFNEEQVVQLERLARSEPSTGPMLVLMRQQLELSRKARDCHFNEIRNTQL